jgi:hypothetical protein
MTSSHYKRLKTGSVINRDSEVELIDRLTVAFTRTGIQADRINIANFYVALKHRPMLILTGPAESGKANLVRCIANLLAGSSDLQGQIASGHAWYARGGPASTVLIGMHARMVTEKLLFMIEEASQPENAQQVFVVGLTHISPAELLSFFTEVAYQLQHNQIMRIGEAHLATSIPFPPNLLMIGTMDTANFDWWDEDLLSGATVIEWRADTFIPQSADSSESQNFGCEFLCSSVRNSRRAYEKLHSVVAGTKQPLRALMLVRGVLQEYGLEFSPALLDEVILYLANAWSAQGNGLFDPSTSRNLAIAFDLALAQLVLPRSLDAIRASETLQAKLYLILEEQLPRSCRFLKRQCEKQTSLVHRKEFETRS